MSTQPPEVNTWEQLSLLPMDRSEITLRIGLLPRSDHAQFQLEVHNVANGELQKIESRPHVPYGNLHSELEEWIRRLRRVVAQLDEPFG